ncbi:unnamed protein product, partial [Didymodactylos carnosus]
MRNEGFALTSKLPLQINVSSCWTAKNCQKIILQATVFHKRTSDLLLNEEVAIYRKRVSLKRLPQSLVTLVDHTIDPLRTMLSRPGLDNDRRATIALHCSKTITQYKFDLMALTIATAEDTARAHAQIAIDAKKELRLLDGDQPQYSTEELIKAIDTRDENMQKRAQQFLDHQLQSFFEQAPMGINDDGSSVPVGAILEDKQAYFALKDLLYRLQTQNLPSRLSLRARRERALVKSIQNLLCKRPDIIVRRIDKSKVFYVSNAVDFARKGADYMVKTEAYREVTSEYSIKGHLKPTTLLVTFDVTILYTMIPRQGALEALMGFWEKYSKRGRIGTLSINDILRMARLVLDTNCFAYDGKYYLQIRGGAMGSTFTQTLANIYMLKWEQPLVKYQQLRSEIYGRYIDDVFMTTNSSRNGITAELEKDKTLDQNIDISYTIHSTVEFLDVAVKNDNGQLTTSVFHKPAAEPYILPYTLDHPRHIHRNILYAALLRAARISSNVHDFTMERIRIDMSLLLTDYPPTFISMHT